MKKEKWLVINSIIAIMALICVFTVYFNNSKRDINKLISELESAINKHDIEKIIELYPDYCKDDVIKYFSQEKLDDFYNNVIVKDGEGINIQILNITDFDISSCDNVKKQIADDYEQDIVIEDYQLVQIKYHDSFSDSRLQVIKIEGNYYLYFYGYIGSPMTYFH
ncbi:MAG: hypothetical protein HDQ95_03265 [Roseburia sp.]|nr:hypothetical protein [Roseburia sp.]